MFWFVTYNSSALVGSEFGDTWEEDVFFEFAVKSALKQDQTLHMEGKLHVILYFREECTIQLFFSALFYYVSIALVHTSEDWTTKPFCSRILSNVFAISSLSIPRLQSSIRIVRNPNSNEWKAVDPAIKELKKKVLMKISFKYPERELTIQI